MRPILLDLPASITTPRLIVRVPAPGDGARVFAAVKESLPELTPWLPWVGKHATADDSEEFARRAYSKFILREDLTMGMVDRTNGNWVGGTGLHRIDWDLPRFEIGYWVRTSYAGKGFVTEGVGALALFAFKVLKAQRVEIRCDAANEKSAAVARRLGFHLEARLEQNEPKRVGGGARDTLIFRRLNADGLPQGASWQA